MYKRKDSKILHSELQCIKEQFRRHQKETQNCIQQLTCQIQQKSEENQQMKEKLQNEIRERNKLNEVCQQLVDACKKHEQILEKLQNNYETDTQWITILDNLIRKSKHFWIEEQRIMNRSDLYREIINIRR